MLLVWGVHDTLSDMVNLSSVKFNAFRRILDFAYRSQQYDLLHPAYRFADFFKLPFCHAIWQKNVKARSTLLVGCSWYVK